MVCICEYVGGYGYANVFFFFLYFLCADVSSPLYFFFLPFFPLTPLLLRLLQILVWLAIPFGSASARVVVVWRAWVGGRMGVCVKSGVFPFF